MSELCLLDGLKTAFYASEFIDEEREKCLMREIDKTPRFRWTQLSNRRLQNWGGVPHPKGMIAEPIPGWLQNVVDEVNSKEGIFPAEAKANHVLLNEYLPGQGIMPHFDGDLFFPTICTLSLGSHSVLDFYQEAEGRRKELSLLVEGRSCLVLKDDMYHKYLHGIEEITSDRFDRNWANLTATRIYSSGEQQQDKEKELARRRRVSLTIRHVPKTSKMKIKLGK